MDHEPARMATIAIGPTAAVVRGLLARRVGRPGSPSAEPVP